MNCKIKKKKKNEYSDLYSQCLLIRLVFANKIAIIQLFWKTS